MLEGCKRGERPTSVLSWNTWRVKKRLSERTEPEIKVEDLEEELRGEEKKVKERND